MYVLDVMYVLRKRQIFFGKKSHSAENNQVKNTKVTKFSNNISDLTILDPIPVLSYLFHGDVKFLVISDLFRVC